jgi:hypothetical protein
MALKVWFPPTYMRRLFEREHSYVFLLKDTLTLYSCLEVKRKKRKEYEDSVVRNHLVSALALIEEC